MMKFFSACLLFGLLLTAAAVAAQPSPAHALNKNIPKPHLSTPVSTGTVAPLVKKGGAATEPAAVATSSPAPGSAPAPAPVAGMTLDAYIQALAAAVPLSKDEQTAIESYYLDDGAKLKSILNDPALSPLQQTQQVDDLRATRNDTIEALLNDAGRQQNFLRVEADYRVALIVLAADGGLVASAPAASVPKAGAAPADTAMPASST